MAKLKIKPNEQSVADFLHGVVDQQKRQDSFAILERMIQATGAEPKMWGVSIIGFDSYCYKYASGREGKWFLTGVSPRKQYLTLYVMSGFEQFDQLLNRLRKYTTGKSCLYIKKLEDIGQDVLCDLINKSVEHMAESNARKTASPET